MKKLIFIFLPVFVVSFLVLLFAVNNLKEEKGQNKIQNVKSKMKIFSRAFENNQKIPKTFTCQGQNINPELNFSDIPQSTKSLVIVMDDPDAPMGTFVHWVIFNIDPKISSISENSSPNGAIQGKNSAGSNQYVGPCPPSGMHRYYFKLYALDLELNLSKDANKQILENAMIGHILDEAQLMGTYQKD